MFLPQKHRVSMISKCTRKVERCSEGHCFFSMDHLKEEHTAAGWLCHKGDYDVFLL